MVRLPLFSLKLNSFRSAAGWCKPSSLVSLALLSLASSPVHAVAALKGIGDKASGDVDRFGGAVTLLIAAFIGLTLLCFVAYALFQLLNQKSD